MIDEHKVINIVDKEVDITNLGTIVAGEKNSELVTFKINRFYDGIDLSLKNVKILYKNAYGIYVEDLKVDKTTELDLFVSWIVSENTCLNPGNTVACLNFVDNDYSFKTKNFKFKVENSVNISDTTAPKPNWFLTIETRIVDMEKSFLSKFEVLNGTGAGSIKKKIDDAIAAENLSQYATDIDLEATNKNIKHIEESYTENIKMPFSTFPKIGNPKNIYIDSNTYDTYVFDGQKYIRTNTSKLPDLINNVLIIKS